MKPIKLALAAALAAIGALAFTSNAKAQTYGDVILGIYDTSGVDTNSLEFDLGYYTTLTNGETFSLGSAVSGQYGASTASNLKFALTTTGGGTGDGNLAGKEILITSAGTFNAPTSNGTENTNVTSLLSGIASGQSNLNTSSNGTQVADAVLANTSNKSFKYLVTNNGGSSSYAFGYNSTYAPSGILASYSSGSALAFDDDPQGGPVTQLGTFSVLAGGVLEYNTNTLSVTPEPSTWALLLGGLGALFYFGRRQRRA
jgi:hypothetical protein